MAARTSNIRYASRSAVYGSNAYDLGRIGGMRRAGGAAPAPSEIQRTPARPADRPSPKTAPSPRSSRRAQRHYGVSLSAAAGFAVVAVLMVFVLLAHVKYAEVTGETVALQRTLDQMSEEERKLRIRYEQVFDVNQVAKYAANQLGMTRPAGSQLRRYPQRRRTRPSWPTRKRRCRGRARTWPLFWLRCWHISNEPRNIMLCRLKQRAGQTAFGIRRSS